MRATAPLVRPGEKAQRDLHAKGLLLVGEKTSLLFCGSSNFSPHGMGVAAANVEANLCFLGRSADLDDNLRLRDRLLEGWEADETSGTIWPEEAGQMEDESVPAAVRLPAVVRWASLDQRSGTLTLGLDTTASVLVGMGALSTAIAHFGFERISTGVRTKLRLTKSAFISAAHWACVQSASLIDGTLSFAPGRFTPWRLRTRPA